MANSKHHSPGQHPLGPNSDSRKRSHYEHPLGPGSDYHSRQLYDNKQDTDNQYFRQHIINLDDPSFYRTPTPSQISNFSALSGAIQDSHQTTLPKIEQSEQVPKWVPLPYEGYESGRRPKQDLIVYFVTINGDELPLSNLESLKDKEEPAPLKGVATKISIRLHFPGTIAYSRQITVLRSTSEAPPIKMASLASKIVEELRKFMKETSEKNQPLRFQGRDVDMNELLLWRFRQWSLGSWIPEFLIMQWPSPTLLA